MVALSYLRPYGFRLLAEERAVCFGSEYKVAILNFGAIQVI